ncbi:hypothetical protein ARMGADRAFT_1070466 [Armillaria gallica]|uniref:Uncharacterized protein n=1 Tax=Armillaria gallica TaxID=47427 RepID=A0A2H3ECE8_ARMGA|nr:hypothetical protein ARMGADRAFT_1070466 [Armillaria gallica]
MATSGKVYYLRNRHTAQGTPRARKQQRLRAVQPQGASLFNSLLTPLPDDTPSVKRELTSPIRLFSQVASSTPVMIGTASPSVRSEDGTAGFVTPFISSPIGSDTGGSDVSSPVHGDGSDVPFEEEDTNPTPWKVVQYGCRRCTYSPVLNTPNLSQFSGSTVTRVRKQMHASINDTKNLGAQDTPISTAKAKLTLAEQELIRKRTEAVVIDDTGIESSWETDSDSHGEGPSSGKGKGIDPSNWGAVRLEEDEADPDAQRKVFAFWNKVREDKSKALQQAYDEQKNIANKRLMPAPPLTPISASSVISRPSSVKASTPRRLDPSPLVRQPVSIPFEPVPEPSASAPASLSSNFAKPEKVKLKKSKRPSVTIEEVMDDDEIEYLVRKAKENSNSKTASAGPSVKPKEKSRVIDDKRSSSVKLSSLMEQQIDQIVHHLTKSKKTKSKKIPKVFVNPSDQIEPDSHLGRALHRPAPTAMGGDPPSDSSGSLGSTSGGSESDFSSNGASRSEQWSSSGSEEDGYLITANRSLRRRHLQEENRAHWPKRKMILKPVPPTKYNSEADSRLFLKFLNNGTAYVREGGVPRRERV